ncbi:hypothetical protein SAMN04488519_11462 [Algoriphagus ornithinivorans]|uniref:Uncharacterized protein n=1 Tax=Algoriphagus ornithinivorans TaxID=226506 RepID=A0A1I5JZN7_9BACT|nr:hypothetical protein SAMN04488519_11462 [Algoriphagus ornithinivorans]
MEKRFLHIQMQKEINPLNLYHETKQTMLTKYLSKRYFVHYQIVNF